jgi:hypothetical protein
MPNYRRPRQSTCPVFFTVCLANKGSNALIEHLADISQVAWFFREFGRFVVRFQP